MNGIFDIALLRGGQIMIEEQQIRRNRSRRACDFFQLATTDESGRIWPVAVLQKFSNDFRASTGGQVTKFVQGFFRAELGLRCRFSLGDDRVARDRKSTRLNSSHTVI